MSNEQDDPVVVPYNRIHFPAGVVVTMVLFAFALAVGIYNQVNDLNDRISELRIANLEAITEMRALVSDRIGAIEQRMTAIERR